MLIPLIVFCAGVMLSKPNASTTKVSEEARGKELMLKITAKDTKAFEAFYFLYAERIGKYLSTMLKRNDWVDEGINDVMLAVWQSAHRFDPDRGKLSTWLFGIAHHKGLKFLERARRRSELPLVDTADEYFTEYMDDPDDLESSHAVSNPERQVLGRQWGDAITWAMSKLSEDHRCTIALCFQNGYSYQEIAEVMGCPENTVKTRMFHARRQLVEHLNCQGVSQANIH